MMASKIYKGQDRGEVSTSMKAINNQLEKKELLNKGYKLHTDN